MNLIVERKKADSPGKPVKRRKHRNDAKNLLRAKGTRAILRFFVLTRCRLSENHECSGWSKAMPESFASIDLTAARRLSR